MWPDSKSQQHLLPVPRVKMSWNKRNKKPNATSKEKNTFLQDDETFDTR